MAPLILGFVLGEQLETHLRRALTLGDVSQLYKGAIAKVLLVAAVLIIIVPPLIKKLRKSKN